MNRRDAILSVSAAAVLAATVPAAAIAAETFPGAPPSVKVFDASDDHCRDFIEQFIDYSVEHECSTGKPITDVYVTKALFKLAIKNNLIDYLPGATRSEPGNINKPYFLACLSA